MALHCWNIYVLTITWLLQAYLVLSTASESEHSSKTIVTNQEKIVTSEGAETVNNLPTLSEAKQIRWADDAYNYIHKLNCSEVFFTSEARCSDLVRVEKSDVNIYIADPSPYSRQRTVIPDDDLDHNDIHDAVLVIDPYPEANLGHLVMVFYVDLYYSKELCEKENGFMLAGGECMTLALKRRCRNAIQRRTRNKRNFARRCEINFIPLVHLLNDNDYKAPVQNLKCRSNLPGYAKCPMLQDTNGTLDSLCNPLHDNTKRCETSHEHIHTSCRVFEICDQAVIISGGWNRWSSRRRYKDSIWDFYHMLKQNGFIDRNIKVFYANGDNNGIVKENGQSKHDVYPAAYKTALRYHIQKVCSLPHCADSLVIYLNGVSRLDGTTLLWDVNEDGIADDEEIYKFEEFLGDIANCHARQVNVIVDQSYAGEIARGARRSQNHRNVAVFASSKDHEYSFRSEFTKYWTKTNHTRKCMKELFKNARHHMDKSTPDLHQGVLVDSKNIFGAPCDINPPFSFKELQKDYLGCQNLPTSVWFKQYANIDMSYFDEDIKVSGSLQPHKTVEVEEENSNSNEHSSKQEREGDDANR